MKTRIIFFFLIIVASCIQAQVRMVAGQPVLFEKQDVIDLATYNWPRTLISYVVVFDGGVKEEMLSLTDKSQGVPVPFQLSEKVVKTDSCNAPGSVSLPHCHKGENLRMNWPQLAGSRLLSTTL